MGREGRWFRPMAGATGLLLALALVAALVAPSVVRPVAAQEEAATEVNQEVEEAVDPADATQAAGEAGQDAEEAAEQAAGQAEGEGGGAGTAQLRVVHVSPDAGNVDILVDGQPLAQGVMFGMATEYFSTASGDRQVQVVPSGQTGEAAVIDQTVTLEDGRTYIVAATNVLASISAQIYEVDRSPIADPTSARVRIIHAAPDVGAVDVGPAGAQPLAQNLGFQAATEYLPVAAGSYDLEVNPTGTQDVAIAAPGTQIQAGIVYDFFAIGQASAGSLSVLQVTTNPVPDCATVLGLGQPGASCVRVVHASPGAPAVDVYLDDNATPAITNLAYGSATEFASVPSGDHQLRITATGTTVDEAVIDETVSLGLGRAYVLAATDVLDSIGLKTDEVDLSQVEGGQARVRVVHAAPGTDAVDVRVANGGPLLFSGIEFNQSSEYVVVPAGPYDLEVVDADGNVLMSAPGTQVEGNMSYDVYAIGREEDGNLALLVLMAPAVSGEQAAATPAAATPGTIGTPDPGATPGTSSGTVVAAPGETPTPAQVQVTATPEVVEVTTTPAPVEVTATPPPARAA